MSLSDIDLRFAKHLFARLKEEQDTIRTNLGSGSHIIRTDAAATGMNCAKMMGEIAGLELAINAIKSVERDLTGKGEPKSKKEHA